jgi:hypothetical protein
MCIACELGYWAMVDALEAEREGAKKKSAVEDPTFACEPDADEVTPSPVQPTGRTVDESAP